MINKPLFIGLCTLLLLISGTRMQAQQTIAEWHFPNNPDDALVDVALPPNTAAVLLTQGTAPPLFTQTGASTLCASATGWHNGANLKYWMVTLNTTGLYRLEVSSKQYSSSTGPRDFKIQYSIGAGPWTDLSGAANITVASNWSAATVTSIDLPPACENQPAVSLRWIMTSNVSVSNGIVASSGNSRIDDIRIVWNADEHYRSLQSGAWHNISTWESSPDSLTWNPAIMTPTHHSRSIVIQNAHQVNINENVKMNETHVRSGGELKWNSYFLEITNGPGTDLTVEGTFTDACSNSILFSGGSEWKLASGGTIIRSGSGSANNWRNSYEGGIANIPATATWILRKTSGVSPALSTLSMYYPNLIIENQTATPWMATATSGFQGTSATVVIKGNFDIGGTATGTVEFENSNTHAALIQVYGDMFIQPGNTLRNYGTGFELFSNLQCNGTIAFDANDAREMRFSGSSSQIVSGAATVSFFNMTMNKTAGDLSLSSVVRVLNNLTFFPPGGRVFSTTLKLLIFASAATCTGAHDGAFVCGPVRKEGTQNFIFPIGKNNDYRPLITGSGNGTVTVEYFRNNPQIVFGNNLSPMLHHISSCEYWMVEAGSGFFPSTVTLSWDVESCGITSVNDLRVARFDATLWQDEGNGGTTGSTAAGTLVSANMIYQQGAFTLASSTWLNPLPVSWLYFDTSAGHDHVALRWGTATESGCEYFSVQRSEDGHRFEEIGRQTGAGTTTAVTNYEFTDAFPLPGETYYRLEQFDKDGRSSYSTTVHVSPTARTSVRCYWSDGDLMIQLTGSPFSGVTRMEIMDMNGRSLMVTSLVAASGESTFTLNTPSLAGGLYALRICRSGEVPLLRLFRACR